MTIKEQLVGIEGSMTDNLRDLMDGTWDEEVVIEEASALVELRRMIDRWDNIYKAYE
jgi:hypothetical protein